MTQSSTTQHVLRDACLALHRELDQKPVFAKLLSADLTLDEYRSGLGALHRGMTAVETAVKYQQASSLAGEVAPYEYRAPLLVQDLQALGMECPRIALEPALVPVSPGAYAGIRYVLEGASLGSAHIGRHLQMHYPDFFAMAPRYWQFQQGQAAGWPAFKLAISQLDQNLPQQANAIAAALAAFRIFIKQVDGNPDAA